MRTSLHLFASFPASRYVSMAISCLVITIGYPIYAYFWQTPIFIQNNIAVKALYPNDQITHYTYLHRG